MAQVKRNWSTKNTARIEEVKSGIQAAAKRRVGSVPKAQYHTGKPLPKRNAVTDKSVTSVPESSWTARQRQYADDHGLTGLPGTAVAPKKRFGNGKNPARGVPIVGTVGSTPRVDKGPGSTPRVDKSGSVGSTPRVTGKTGFEGYKARTENQHSESDLETLKSKFKGLRNIKEKRYH